MNAERGAFDPSRRRLLRLVGLGIAGSVLLPAPATSARRAPWSGLPAAQALLDGAEAAPRGLTLELPSVAENASAVALSVASEHDVEAIHLFAPRNPDPAVAVFRFHSPLGVPRVSTRVRLDETQTVIALARTREGQWLGASREVRVTVSGCLAGDNGAEGNDEMQTRVRIPQRTRAGTAVEVLALINHPMETGFREDERGELVPRRIVERFELDFDGEPLIEARLHPSIAANPFLRLNLRPERSGDLDMRWTEDTGRTGSASGHIEVN